MAKQRKYVPEPLPPKRIVLGRATVRTWVGEGQPPICFVTEGRIALGDIVDVFTPGGLSDRLRNVTQLLAIDARVALLRREQDDAKEIHAGFECNIGLQTAEIVLRPGDIVEAFEIIR